MKGIELLSEIDWAALGSIVGGIGAAIGGIAAAVTAQRAKSAADFSAVAARDATHALALHHRPGIQVWIEQLRLEGHDPSGVNARGVVVLHLQVAGEHEALDVHVTVYRRDGGSPTVLTIPALRRSAPLDPTPAGFRHVMQPNPDRDQDLAAKLYSHLDVLFSDRQRLARWHQRWEVLEPGQYFAAAGPLVAGEPTLAPGQVAR